MDIPYELPLPPEPPVPPQASPAQPDLPINGIVGDPLCQMLGRLEAATEQPVFNPYPDLLSKTLDNLEASIEQQSSVADFLPDPINETLSQLEKKIESQHSTVSKNKEDLSEEFTPPMQDGFHQINRQSRFPSDLPQKPQVNREPFSHQHPEPTHRMSGQSTGIRNSGNGFDWYCYMREEWVSKEECGNCSDFEESDYSSDKEGRRCKHSFSSSQDNDEEDEHSEPEDME